MPTISPAPPTGAPPSPVINPIKSPLPGIKPNPMPQPLRVHPMVIVTTLDQTLVCPFGSDDSAKKQKQYNPTGKKAKKQQRPCKNGAKPIVTYSKRRRAVATLRVNPKYWWNRKSIKSDPKYKRWKNKHYPGRSGQSIELEIQQVDYMTYLEKQRKLEGFTIGGALDMKPGKNCFYLIYEVGKRRKCKCPDGSKCNR